MIPAEPVLFFFSLDFFMSALLLYDLSMRSHTLLITKGLLPVLAEATMRCNGASMIASASTGGARYEIRIEMRKRSHRHIIQLLHSPERIGNSAGSNSQFSRSNSAEAMGS